MKFFVTGSSGYIGGSIIKRLVGLNHEVVALIHKNDPKERLDTVLYIQGDITNVQTFSSSIKDIDVVFHCAAYVKDYGPKKIFYEVNVQGTKQLIELFTGTSIKRFFFLSHLPYESSSVVSKYTVTKQIAESVLQEAYEESGFPMTIIRPGNIYGPGDTLWVRRPIQALLNNRLLLVDKGTGIFHHTYIDNLLDALMICTQHSSSLGKTIEITDGDNLTTWATYFNDLAAILGKEPITRTISKKTAQRIGFVMQHLFPLFNLTPWITSFAVDILTNTMIYDIKKVQQIIDYEPKVTYTDAMIRIKEWIESNGVLAKDAAVKRV